MNRLSSTHYCNGLSTFVYTANHDTSWYIKLYIKSCQSHIPTMFELIGIGKPPDHLHYAKLRVWLCKTSKVHGYVWSSYKLSCSIKSSYTVAS